MAEVIINNYVSSVALGGYTAGSGVLNVGSTAPYVSGNTSTLWVGQNGQSTPIVLLRINSVNSGTQFGVTAEGLDTSAPAGSVVAGSCMSAIALRALGGGGGTPGGSNTQLQYNNAGSFGGITGATSNGTSVTLTSPTLVTPALGTPASGNASNLTNLPITLTTTGTSGAATYTQATNTLNVPQYSGGGGSSGALVLLEEHTASTSAALNFTTRNVSGQSGNSFQSDFDTYQIEVINIVPDTGVENILLQVSTDSGATYDTSTNYNWAAYRQSNAGQTGAGSNGDTSLGLDASGGVSNVASAGGLVGYLQIFDPLNAAQFMRVRGSFGANDGGAHPDVVSFIAGSHIVTVAVNAIRVKAGGGANLASGKIRLYGIAK